MEELDLMALDFSSIDDIIDSNPLELLEKAAKASEEKEVESVLEKTEKYIVELDALTPNNKPKEPVKTEVKKEELNIASINTPDVSDEYGAVGSPGKVFVPGAKRQTKAKTATKAPTKKQVPNQELQEAEIATFLDGVKNPFTDEVVESKPKAKQATIDDLFEDIIIETSKAKAETKEAVVVEKVKVEEVKAKEPVAKEEPKVEVKAEVKEEPKAEIKEEAKIEEKPKKTTRKRQTKKETVKEEEVDEILSEEDIKELRTTLRQIVRKELRLAIKDAFKDLSEEF